MISLSRTEIEALIDLPSIAPHIDEAYRLTSAGEINLPPVGHITFPNLNADCHIKYGHLLASDSFVIKVATGFPSNAALGLETGNGLVLVMSAKTGVVQAVLHDEMLLTDVRTGIGGAIASRVLARKDSERVLIVGTGPQARRQIQAHAALMPNPLRFELWGRNTERTKELAAVLSNEFDITYSDDLQTSVKHADIIVTATGANSPLLHSEWVHAGTHITAVGADAPGKQELDPNLMKRADVIAVDLATQCFDHGEVSHAFHAGLIHKRDVTELGVILKEPSKGRVNEGQITLADLTGIAAQDIAIATCILNAHTK
ncbi:ornithine cyclodeaminase family protein [Planktotalea sp.]|uniref:ornithine cyclodeaminase family protein n=1 Tax=Planktotalea sp. TaxID=2029877 RepID=UPI003F6B6869